MSVQASLELELPAPVNLKATALAFVKARPEAFRAEFGDWLDRNWHIWRAFEREANRIWSRGRRRYSARTIVHWLRHETAVAEAGSEFKVNNNYSPDLARLYVMHYPDRAEFFEFRLMAESARAA